MFFTDKVLGPDKATSQLPLQIFAILTFEFFLTILSHSQIGTSGVYDGLEVSCTHEHQMTTADSATCPFCAQILDILDGQSTVH